MTWPAESGRLSLSCLSQRVPTGCAVWGCRWYRHNECAPYSYLTLNAYLAAMVTHYPMTYTEPQSGSSSISPCREVRQAAPAEVFQERIRMLGHQVNRSCDCPSLGRGCHGTCTQDSVHSLRHGGQPLRRRRRGYGSDVIMVR